MYANRELKNFLSRPDIQQMLNTDPNELVRRELISGKYLLDDVTDFLLSKLLYQLQVSSVNDIAAQHYHNIPETLINVLYQALHENPTRDLDFSVLSNRSFRIKNYINDTDQIDIDFGRYKQKGRITIHCVDHANGLGWTKDCINKDNWFDSWNEALEYLNTECGINMLHYKWE